MNLHLFLIILLIYVHLQIVLTQSESTCKNISLTCNCTSTGTKVDCSGLGLSRLPDGIPRNTTHLDLSNNEFADFETDTFLRFPSLYQINLNGNKLTKMPTFNGAIKNIYLSGNKISSFDNGTFLQYHRLQRIELRRNNFSRIPMFPDYTENIDMAKNPLEIIEPYKFFNLKRNTEINIVSDTLKELQENSFAMSTNFCAIIKVHGKSLSKISSGSFKNISTSGRIMISDTNITRIPARMIQETRILLQVELSFSKVSYIDPDAFKDQEIIFELFLHNNMITEFPRKALFNPLVRHILDLSWNNITSLGVGPILNKSPAQIYLVKNQIQNISKDNFSGLNNLTDIILLQNQLTHIADGAFQDTNILGLLLQSNLLTNITDRTFYMESRKLENLYIYDNPLQEIDDNALSSMAVNSTTYINCENLKKVPVICGVKNLYCVTNTTDIVFDDRVIDKHMGKNRLSGMICNDSQCRPCKQGHYGYVGRSNQYNKCYACPPGGFYQDILGYANLGDYTANCKTCPVGSFSPTAGAQSVADCQTCPKGTKTDRVATLNACECLDNFHRTDRFGECEPCPVGVNCTDGVQNLIQGYWCSWDSMGKVGNINAYKDFVSNMTDSEFDEYNPDELNATKYIGQLPAVYACLRNKSCLGGGIDGNCSDGYSGWLCAACDHSYYELFNECYQCQKIAIIITIYVVIIIVFTVVGVIVWKLDKRRKGNASMTSFFIHIKITINFYQILGILSEVNEIHWPDDFQSVGQSLQYLDIIRYVNILSPKCIFPGTWNAYTLLYIAIATPFAIVMLTSIIFCLQSIFYRYRGEHSVHNIKDKYLSIAIMMLYLTYANTCSSIMAVGPWSIRKFDVTANGSEKVSILTSDYSINVEQDDDGAVYNIHKNIVYYSLIYVVCFPLIVVVVLYFKYKRVNVVNNVDISQPKDSGLVFFLKQYTNRFWYWEVLEMYNKAVLALIANFKDDQASNMSYSLFITVVLIALHLYLEPMNNKSDQRFKLLTLCFIVVNLSVGAIVDLDATLYKEDNAITFLHDVTPFILLLINFSILFLLFVDFIKKIKEDIWDSLNDDSALNNTTEIESGNNDVRPLVYHDEASSDGEESLII